MVVAVEVQARRYIEWRLERYKRDKRNLEELQELPSSSYGVYAPDRLRTHSGHSRPLEDLAIKRVSDSYYQDIKRTVNCIDHVLDRLQPEDLTLIRLLYIDNTHNIDGAALECCMSRRTAYRHSSAILMRIARELGIENRE